MHAGAYVFVEARPRKRNRPAEEDRIACIIGAGVEQRRRHAAMLDDVASGGAAQVGERILQAECEEQWAHVARQFGIDDRKHRRPL